MLLSVDTSSPIGMVVLSSADSSTFSFRISADPHSHSQVLLGFIHELLTDANIGFSDLSGFTVVVGPGSFVGVRLGVSVIQGLAYGSNHLVWPISGLHVLAQSAFIESKQASIRVQRDAHMGEVYVGEYAGSPEGLMRPLQPDLIEKKTEQTLFSEISLSPTALHQVAWDAFTQTPGLKPEELFPRYLRGANLWRTLLGANRNVRF